MWSVSLATHEAKPVRCKSWACPYCKRFKQMATALVLEHGVRTLQCEGRRVRFMTLTDTADGDMTTRELHENFKALRKRLDRQGKLGPYACVVAPQERGALHLHALVGDPDGGDGYISQRGLSEMAQAVGFGQVCDIRAVASLGTPFKDLGEYLGKQMAEESRTVARYTAAQSSVEATRERGARRLRPFRASRTWPVSLGTAEAAMYAQMLAKAKDPDPGPFEVWSESSLGHDLAEAVGAYRPVVAMAA